MDFSLFNQNVVVLLSLLAAVSVTYIVSHLRPMWYGRRFVYLLFGALLACGAIEAAAHMEFPSDKLPTLLWLMILPFTFAASLIVAAWGSKVRWLKWLSLATCVLCFVFSAALINGYYRFYPTLFSVFSSGERLQALSQTTVNYSGSGASHSVNATIEGSLYATAQTTNGQVHSLSIPGTVSKFHPRTAWVYVPAIASSSGHINLPVVVLLPGIPGFPSNWLGSGLESTMDQFAKLHHGITPIVFMVDDTGSLTNDTECVNSPRGNVETYLTTDVPKYIKAHYDVSDDSSDWAIGGLSMGGMCSVMLSLRHPNVYRNFLDLGGETGPEVGPMQQTVDKLFYGSASAWAAHQPLLLLQHKTYYGMNGFFAIGNGDKASDIAGMEQLYQQSKTAGIESVYEEIGGQHTFSVWQQSFKDSLPWLSNRLGATECLSSCVQ